jgi:hypothetical protein
MNAKTLTLTAGLLAALATTVAMANPNEYELNQNLPTPVVGGLSRAEVRSQTLQAQQAGTLALNEYQLNQYATAVVPSALQRVQVLAEAQQARTLGLITHGDGPVPEATPAQAELIRQAGLQAVNHHLASR